MYWVRIPNIIVQAFPNYQWKVKSNQIALTFDDGPHCESTFDLLQILEKASIQTTHFLLGENCINSPENFQLLKNSSHRLGHHTYHHLNGWKSNKIEYLEDVEKAYNVVQTNMFRPPYGKITPSLWNGIRREYAEMKCCLFNFMPGDFDKNVDKQLLKKRMYEVKGGDIIVLHDRPECLEKYAPFLSDWVADMKGKGWEFVSL